MVNKFWNYEARSVLRDQKKCVAVIKGNKPCSRAKKLNDMLGSLAVIPFNGLDVKINGYHHCGPEFFHGKTEEIYRNLLKMPLKYLNFLWRNGIYASQTGECVLSQILLTLMQSCLTLEHLHISDIPRNIELDRNKGHEKVTSQLPKLKTLELLDGKNLTESLLESLQLGRRYDYRTYNEEIFFWSNLLSIISGRAPNLEELKNMVDLDWIQYVPTEKFRIFKNIKLPSFWGSMEEDLKLMNKLCIEGPRICTLNTEFPRVPPGYLRIDLYWTLLFDILCRSSGSLQQVMLDSRSAFMLRKFAWRMQPLAIVKHLEFELSGQEEASISRFLTPVTLAKLFPSISAVTINWNHHRVPPRVDQGAEFRCPAVFPWPAVTKVTLRRYGLRNQSIRDLAILFPNLRTLVLPCIKNYKPGNSFRQIWSQLPRLEKLVMSMTGKLSCFCGYHFDAQFCGIYDEEAAILRKMDEAYLKTVNIVPPFRPIHYLRGKLEIL